MDVLPDSRLKERKNTFMMDVTWDECHLDGTVTRRVDRVEFEPIYCMSCGKYTGHVIVDCTTSASWMCTYCSEEYGVEAAQSELSDRVFWRKVNDEIIRRFKRALTDDELSRLAEHGKLGRPLELLERESPYRRSIR